MERILLSLSSLGIVNGLNGNGNVEGDTLCSYPASGLCTQDRGPAVPVSIAPKEARACTWSWIQNPVRECERVARLTSV